MQSQGTMETNVDWSNLVAIRNVSVCQETSCAKLTFSPIRKDKVKMMKAISFVQLN